MIAIAAKSVAQQTTVLPETAEFPRTRVRSYERLDGANGLAVTPDGVVYVVHGFRDQVWRIPEAGTLDARATLRTANRLVEHPDGERLAFTQAIEGGTLITTMRLVDPGSRETFVEFNPRSGPAQLKGIDDVVVAPRRAHLWLRAPAPAGAARRPIHGRDLHLARLRRPRDVRR